MPATNIHHIPLEDAQARLLDRITPVTESECLPLQELVGRVCFEDVVSVMPQPPFDRSPLDGYALRHVDSSGASRQNPRHVRVTQHLFAGMEAVQALRDGECARIMTGAMLPPGADCVIAQENTDGGESHVALYMPLRKHQNVCFKGEDVEAGQRLAYKGQVFSSALLGILAGQGFAFLHVFRRPSVAVMASGDELFPLGQPLPPGKIYNSNSPLLAARLQSLGINVFVAEPCRDEPDALHQRVRALLSEHDMVITTGGVSVGQKDYLPDAAERLGGDTLFHGISIKPGSPALAVAWEGKVLLALSGNPHAATVTFETLAVPALKKLAGFADVQLPRQQAVVRGTFGKASDMRRLIRARLECGDVIIPPKGHASGILSTWADCNCLIDIPAGSTGVTEGDTVDVIRV